MSGPYGSDGSFAMYLIAAAGLVLAVTAIIEWIQGR